MKRTYTARISVELPATRLAVVPMLAAALQGPLRDV